MLIGLVYGLVRDYVSGLANADQLLDMISESQEGQGVRAPQGALLYPEVWYTSQATDQELTSIVLHTFKTFNWS
jgi:hypothetical protein